MLTEKEVLKLLSDFLQFRSGIHSQGFGKREGQTKLYSLTIQKSCINNVQIPTELFCLKKSYKSYQNFTEVFFKFAAHCLVKDLYTSKGMIRDEDLKLIGFTYFNSTILSNYHRIEISTNWYNCPISIDLFEKERDAHQLSILKKVINICIRSSYCNNKGIIKLISFLSENEIPFTILPDNEFEIKYRSLVIKETVK